MCVCGESQYTFKYTKAFKAKLKEKCEQMGIENVTVTLNECGNVTFADSTGNWNWTSGFTVPDGMRCVNEGKLSNSLSFGGLINKCKLGHSWMTTKIVSWIVP